MHTPAAVPAQAMQKPRACPLQALPDWPNVLATGHTAATALPSGNERLDELAWSANADGSTYGGGMHLSESAPSLAGSSGGSNGLGLSGGGGRLGSGSGTAIGSTSRLGSILRRKPSSPAALLSGPVDHCWLSYKPLSRPDRTVLDRLVQPQPAGALLGPRCIIVLPGARRARSTGSPVPEGSSTEQHPATLPCELQTTPPSGAGLPPSTPPCCAATSRSSRKPCWRRCCPTCRRARRRGRGGGSRGLTREVSTRRDATCAGCSSDCLPWRGWPGFP